MIRLLLALVLAATAAGASAQSLLDWTDEEVRSIGRHGPWPPPPVRDPSNRVSGTSAGTLLGEHLFNEPRLSGDGRMSCATCHQAGRDWSDGQAKAQGAVELDRRTPSLWNVGYSHWFGWDGAGDSLWAQSIRPLLDPREMNGGTERVGALLRNDSVFACGYEKAFDRSPDNDDERLLVDAAKALAAFQATLVSPRTPFDAFRDALLAGDRDGAARYPLSAQRGLRLFIGAANCNACHFGPRFTNGEFGDVGIPFFVRPGEVDSGRLGGLERLAASPFNLLGRFNDDTTGEAARRTRHVRRLHSNFGEFRVPGLRQVGRGGPYMHNGSIATLEDVVKHYSEVNPDRLHSDGVPLVRPLALSSEQSADLVAFLRSLDADVPPRPAPAPLCP
ncbi:cytochrome-c peroxidase [Reyranella massiliensis]|uniref:cytochrome-c peroxidase n=1 Tax=Reyranella massiliensis TaxID=445220 RepID=UPI0002F711E8|nr:cytochrome c peroxidase [Reyranella massiliensis]